MFKTRRFDNTSEDDNMNVIDLVDSSEFRKVK